MEINVKHWDNPLEKSTKLLNSEIDEAASFLTSKTKHRPQIAIICGTGLNHLSQLITCPDVIEYKDIPHFVCPTVPGHVGRLVIGECNGITIACLQGRVHMYEGSSMWKVTLPVRVMERLGVKALIVTNAAGGINQDFRVGDLMIIRDHVNLAALSGLNPLMGLNDDRFGTRFVNVSAPYDRSFRESARQIAKDKKLNFIREGVHFVQAGPTYETTAECRMLRILGADTIGMSTAPEVVVARQLEMRCFGLAMVTNISNLEFDRDVAVNHEEVLEAGENRAKDVQSFVYQLINDFNAIMKKPALITL